MLMYTSGRLEGLLDLNLLQSLINVPQEAEDEQLCN